MFVGVIQIKNKKVIQALKTNKKTLKTISRYTCT